MTKKFEIIDFHTHPFKKETSNICSHTSYCKMSAENTKTDILSLGISKICGSVISSRLPVESFDDVKALNDEALELRTYYGGFYIPGFHIHPAFVKESLEEVERMHSLGVNLVGELVPYLQNWNDFNYSSAELYEILELCEYYDMVISLHTMDEDALDKLVYDHKNLKIVAAHPGEYGGFQRHLSRMAVSENYYVDVSGTGLFRHGMLRHIIDEYGADRVLFGSDYPTCNPAMFVGGVRDDFLLCDEEKEKILSGNAKRLLKI